MTHQQRLQLTSELASVCDGGEVDEIMEVMNSHFHELGTARSVFCVSDRKYHRDFLPEPREFCEKGYLHCFLTSQRIMTVKNINEGTDFQYTYTISLDTNFPSYLQARASGRSLNDLEQAFTESLQFLAPYRSGIDIMPYLYENADSVGSDSVRESVKAYLQFIFAEDAPLQNVGEIVCSISDSALEERLNETIRMIQGSDWQALASHAKRNWAVAYSVLLAAATIHIQHPRKGARFRLSHLLHYLDSHVGFFPQQEIFFAHAFFERGNQERFFRRIQRNASDLAAELRNMAWDLAHPRTILDNVSAAARVNSDHADFVVPYLFTFDQPVRALMEGFQFNALITYVDEGAKHFAIFPLALFERISDTLRGSEGLFEPDRIQTRLKLGADFHSRPERRQEVIQTAETELQAALSNT